MSENTKTARRRAGGEGMLRYDDKRRLWVGRVPRAADPKRPVVYARTQGEARDKLRRAIRNAERGLRALNENTKLRDYLDPPWLDVVRSRVESGKLAPSSAVAYERDVRTHLIPILGRVPLRKLTPGQVEAMFGKLLAASFAPATVRHVRATLSRALRDAERDNLIGRNVARLSDPPQLDKHNPSAFSMAEYKRIVEACGADRLGSLFLFAANTGTRRSEVLALRWSDVDLDEATFQVREGLHQISKNAARVTGATGLVTSRPKTEASGDALPLSSQAVTLLREHRPRQLAERLRCRQDWPDDADTSRLFTTMLGTPLQPSNVSRAWRKILETAKVPHLTEDGRARGMHELRRTFATRLRDRGVPLEDVQRLGRWASSKMLLEVYSASDENRLRTAAKAVGDALSE